MSREALACDPRGGPRLPAEARPPWPPLRGGDCACGFAGAHPACAACGIAIGPDHEQTAGRELPLPVYRDAWDEAEGCYRLSLREESQLCCARCVRDVLERGLRLRPVRRLTSRANRLRRINRWRRRRGLPEIDATTTRATDDARLHPL